MIPGRVKLRWLVPSMEIFNERSCKAKARVVGHLQKKNNMFLSLWDLLPRCLHILHDVNAVLPVPAYHLIPALPQK